MARTDRVAAACLSAGLYLAAFAPLDLSLLVFVALLPWLWSLKSASRRQGFRSGYLMGTLIVLGQMMWVVKLVQGWTGSALLGLLPWVLCGLIGGLYFALLGWGHRVLAERRLLLLFPVLWAGMEVLRSYVPGLSFPWFLIGEPLIRTPLLAQPGFFGTIYLCSAAVVAVSLLLAGLPQRDAKALKVAVSLVAAAGFVRWLWPTPGTPTRVAVGQPGVDMAFGSSEERGRVLTPAIDRLVAQAESDGAQMLVLPEGLVNAGDAWPPQTPFYVSPLVPTLFGGRRGVSPVYQSAFAHDRGQWTSADKTRLVVFGEYVPFRDVIPFLRSFRLPQGDLQPGREVKSVTLGGVSVGPMICFEGLFWDLSHRQAEQGAQLLAVISIDDWYMDTAAPEQLRDSTLWRAVETGLPVVRSASLGYSILGDAKGRLVAQAPLRSTTLLVGEVAVPAAAPSFAPRAWFPWAFALSWLAMPFLGVRRRREPNAP